jgi:hypothetical protein
VRDDPVKKGLLFAGTEKSVWVSFDAGDHWQSLQLNLPHSSMRDLWVKDDDLIVATHGRSFWVLDDISPLREATTEVATSDVHLFRPARAYRIMRSTNTDTPYPPDEPMAANPPNGAAIDYFLGRAADGPVVVEILDQAGARVRRYSSEDRPSPSAKAIAMQLIPPYWLRPHSVPGSSAGMHRVVWDLTYTAPASSTHEYPIAAVPHDTPRHPLGVRAPAGQYTVRLSASGKTLTAPLTVVMDPRVKTPADALARQFDLSSTLSRLLNDGAGAATEAASVKEQLKQIAGQAKGGTAEAIKELTEKVEAVLDGEHPAGGTPAPGLGGVVGNVYALYGTVGQADAGPTAAQVTAAGELSRQVPDLIKRWQAIVSTQVPALNRRLKAAHLPEIDPARSPSHAEEGGDKDEG